jgi:predicted small metal-binding protein
MAYTLSCKDLGEPTCPFVARAETKEEVLAQTAKHAKEVHGYTDAQLSDPKMIEQTKAQIKQA